MPPRPSQPRNVPASAVAGFIDQAALEPVVGPLLADAGGRDFLLRCLVSEGPVHHRGANWVLLRLLGDAVRAAGVKVAPPADAVAVPLHLPPHAAHDEAEQSYPVGLALAPLERLAAKDSRELEAMVDCLTDGPAQHVSANIAMVALLGQLIDALEKK